MSTVNQQTLAESGTIDTQGMWQRVKRLTQGTDISQQERHLRLMNEFDQFAIEAGESLTFMYESKYVTLTRQNYTLDTNHFNKLYDYLSQYEPHVNASRVKKATRNHDPLALVANSYANPSHSHASTSHSHLQPPYYVTHPPSMHDYDDDYQGEIQGEAQEDKLSTAMMLLTRAITQHYSTPTNNRLRTSSNTRNQAVIQDGHVDIQRRNVGYAENGSRNARRININQATNARNGFVQKTDENEEIVQRILRTTSTRGKINVQCYNCNGKGHYARDCPKPRVRDAKYFREQMMLVAKDEVGVNLDTEENDFMLINAYGDN
ncbi:integrase, catalytic region, zinc finger, CCHC-type containing protein [Tanacetum coccineum]